MNESPKRGEVYDAALDAPQGESGSEQAGFRPVIVVSRDALNAAASVVVVVPCTTYRQGKTVYPSQILLAASEGGLQRDSVALGEQVRAISKRRLRRRRGALSVVEMRRLEQALLITLDLGTKG